MNFFEKITAFFNKIEEWNEEQKKIFKEKQFQEQKKELKKFVKKMNKQNELIDNFNAKNAEKIAKKNQSKFNTEIKFNMEVKMFTVFPDSANQTPSPFEEMYYANHEEYGILEKEYTRFSARFQSKQCPYCQNVIEKLSTRSRVCPHCKKRFYVKQNFHSEEYMLLSEEEWKPLQQERLFFDWDEYTAEAEFHLKRRDFGLYRNAKYHLLETGYALHKFSPYGMLVKCFELYYLDFSGPNNVHDLSSSICPAFKQDTFIAPAVLGWIEVAVEEYPQTLEQYEQIFLTEMEKVRLPEQKTLPKTAWNKLKREIKKYLEYSDEEGID